MKRQLILLLILLLLVSIHPTSAHNRYDDDDRQDGYDKKCVDKDRHHKRDKHCNAKDKGNRIADSNTRSRRNNDIDLKSKHLEIELEITNGYYTALDDDGVENDVITEYSMEIEADDSIRDALKHTDIEIILTLTLPSGRYFEYSYDRNYFRHILNWNQFHEDEASVDVRVYFPDHALEAGDYTFTMEISIDGKTKGENIASIVFDPPGSEGGLPPPPYFRTI